MYINPRKQKSFKKKITVYILLLVILTSLLLLLNSNFISAKPLFISPLGKTNTDITTVEKSLKRNNILFSNVVIASDSSYVINIPNNGQVRLSAIKDINKQISSLQRILVELTIEGKPFKNIDFRFEEPIVSF